MSEELRELMFLLNEIADFQHAQDMKIFSSFFIFATSFITGTCLMYDVFRGKKRKLAGSKWHTTFVSLSFFFYSLCIFGLARAIDGIQDMAFLLDNPQAMTTLSQRSLILEVPLIGIGIMTLIFLFFGAKTYFKIKCDNGEKD